MGIVAFVMLWLATLSISNRELKAVLLCQGDHIHRALSGISNRELKVSTYTAAMNCATLAASQIEN